MNPSSFTVYKGVRVKVMTSSMVCGQVPRYCAGLVLEGCRVAAPVRMEGSGGGREGTRHTI